VKRIFLVLLLSLFSTSSFAAWVQVGSTAKIMTGNWDMFSINSTLDAWASSWATRQTQYAIIYRDQWYINSMCDGTQVCAEYKTFAWSGTDPVTEMDCASDRITCSGNIPTPVSCSTETVSGGSISGGSSGIFADGACAVSCSTDYSKLDGNTSLYDANYCTGLGQEYVTAEPTDYPSPPVVCEIKTATGSCLDMQKQPNGSCPVGTTYGRVNDIDVCVPSGTSTAATDEGSTGVPESGGSMQAEGTADRAGTGGSSTGSGTSTGSSSSTTTTNADGSQTTTGTSEGETSGPTTFGGHGDPSSWWESKYPDGVNGIATKFKYDVQTSALLDILSPLESLPDTGSEPQWSMSFDIGALGNFGVMSFSVPEGVWLFVRFCILFTATFFAMRLIFGGA